MTIYHLIFINKWLVTCQCWDVMKSYTPPTTWAVHVILCFVFLPPLFFWAASLVRLHVRGGQAGGIWRGEEVAEALLWQVPVLVVVEGLSRQLAEEVGMVPGAAGATASTQGTMRGCQRLSAAAAAYTTGHTHTKKGYCISLVKKNVDQEHSWG